MDTTLLAHDKSLAQTICQALLAGDRSPFREIVCSFQKLFLPFARRRLFNPQDGDDVLQNFWEELLNGRAICHYARQTEHRLTLRSFCLGILHRRIIDRNRQFTRERQRAGGEPPALADPGEAPDCILEQEARDRLARCLVHGALIRLAEQSPRDAELLRWHLEGLSYEDMAGRLPGSGQADAAGRHKKINAIKKQFTRPGSGSLARFKAALLELMQQQGLSYDDF
jgi:DNA-directed RNA polymerase specialized sigma24 family protein